MMGYPGHHWLIIVGKFSKLNEDLPLAGQSPPGALARNTHQNLMHTLRTILHRCICKRREW